MPYPPPGDLPKPGIRPEPFTFPGLWSMGLQQVRQNWMTKQSTALAGGFFITSAALPHNVHTTAKQSSI